MATDSKHDVAVTHVSVHAKDVEESTRFYKRYKANATGLDPVDEADTQLTQIIKL